MLKAPDAKLFFKAAPSLALPPTKAVARPTRATRKLLNTIKPIEPNNSIRLPKFLSKNSAKGTSCSATTEPTIIAKSEKLATSFSNVS